MTGHSGSHRTSVLAVLPLSRLIWNPTVGGNRACPDPGSPALQLDVYLIVSQEIGICYQAVSLRWSVLCEGACSCPSCVHKYSIFHGSACALFYNAMLGTGRGQHSQTFFRARSSKELLGHLLFFFLLEPMCSSSWLKHGVRGTPVSQPHL